MAHRRKSTSRKKGSSHFWSKLLFILILLILGVGFGIWKYPTTARQWVAVIVEKVRPAWQNPPLEPQPEPSVTQSTTIPPEPVVTVPGSTTAQQPVITVQTQYDHLKLGVPGKADTIIDRPGYALGYIEYHEQPAWVVYHFTKEEAVTKAVKRSDDFREDPRNPHRQRNACRLSPIRLRPGASSAGCRYGFLRSHDVRQLLHEQYVSAETGIQSGHLEEPGSAGSILCHHGEGHLRCHRTSFAEDQDRDHWRKPGDRADALLQGHLRPNSAGKDDRLHFAKRRKQSTASGLCRYRGCRGRCHGAEFLFHGSAAEAGTVGKRDIHS